MLKSIHTVKLSIIALLAILLVSCDSADQNQADIINSSAKASEFHAQNNRFGLSLFKQLNQKNQNQNNIVISPVSTSMALGMVYNGTSDETREELASILGWDHMENQEINNYHKNLITYYNNYSENIDLRIANSIWYNQSADIHTDFLTNNKEYFSALTKPFEDNNPATAEKINTWIRNKSNGHINSVINSISSDDLMYIINATYFKGDWKYEFNASHSAETTFSLEDGTQKSTTMMWQKADLNYFEGELFQMVELPYKNESYCMYILLPDEGIQLNNMIDTLDNMAWNSYKGQLEKKRNINFGMPKFHCEYNVGMNEMLSHMGLHKLIGEENINFKNISDNPLSISEVMHKAAIDVDEQGTEATATTSLAISFTALVDDNPFNLVVDRPFVFAIEEKNSNSLLFIGKITNP